MPFRYGNDDDGSGDSDGLTLTSDDGTAINWGAAAVFTLGTLAAEFFDGLGRFVATVWNSFAIGPLNGATEFATDAVEELLGLPSTILSLSFAETARFLEQDPVLGMAIGVMFVIALAYLAARVIPRG